MELQRLSLKQKNTVTSQAITYEKIGLTEGIHTVKLNAGTSGTFRMTFDAIDIDDTRYLMTPLGTILTAPETGWQRYDDSNPKFSYTNMTVYSSANEYNGGQHYNGSTNNTKVQFSFYGTKIRLIASMSSLYSTTPNTITIDGVSETYTLNNGGGSAFQRLVYEKTGLSTGLHIATITPPNGVPFDFDAIDIDNTGYLAAQVGHQLITPETTWQRIDDNNINIAYYGDFEKNTSDTNAYGGSFSKFFNGGVKIKFKGTKTRVIAMLYKGDPYKVYSSSINVKIDEGTENVINETYSALNNSTSVNYKMIVYEKTGLPDGIHTINVSDLGYRGNPNRVTLIDAIDIDDTGYLVP